MKKHSVVISITLMLILLATNMSLFGCVVQKQYSLSVNGSELLYEDLKDSYRAGEEVKVKVKITPYENTVAYLGIMPLSKTKNSQDDFYIFTFEMPNKSAVLSIENIKGFQEDLLTGFYLTFYDNDDNSIESLNKEVTSSEAVADYHYYYFDENFGNNVYTSNDGADVFTDGMASMDINFDYGLSEFELTDTLYFTYEMLGAVARVHWVYFNEQTGNISTSGVFGHKLSGISASTFNTQSLSDTRYSIIGEEYNATFNSNVTVKFEFIDYLTGVKVLEYDKNNQLIKSSNFVGKKRSESFAVSASCEYVVIEEEYTVMNDEANKGGKHYERALINKNTIDSGITLKYPRGDGLISPVHLSIAWQE